MKKAFLLVAHGSKSTESLGIVDEILNYISKNYDSFNIFEKSFMEINNPSIEIAVDNLVNKSINSIIIVPYFLFKGVHIQRDISGTVSELKNKYPQINFKLAEPLGFDESIGDLLVKRGLESLNNL